MTIRLSKSQKFDLAKILSRSGKLTAMLALHMARPKTKMLDCIRYIRVHEDSLLRAWGKHTVQTINANTGA